MLTAADPQVAFAFYVPQAFCAGLWAGPAVATVQDLVLPRMRGTASAAYLLLVTLAGLALGPFAIGRLSVAWGDLRAAMLCGLVANAVAVVCGLVAARRFAADEATMRERAGRAGEATPG